MPSYTMQYEDENGNKLDQPIKVETHRTQPPVPPMAVEAQLVEYFTAEQINIDKRPPTLSALKKALPDINTDKATRDRAWSRYTLEQQVNKEAR